MSGLVIKKSQIDVLNENFGNAIQNCPCHYIKLKLIENSSLIPIKDAKIDLFDLSFLISTKNTNDDGIAEFLHIYDRNYKLLIYKEGYNNDSTHSEDEGINITTKTKVMDEKNTITILVELKKSKFEVTSIPDIMRRNGWNEGARLMEHWFQSKSYTMPNDTNSNANIPIEKSIITLNFIKKYKRGMAGFEKITDKNTKIWLSSAAKDIIFSRIKDNKLLPKIGEKRKFNFIDKNNADICDKNYIQFESVPESYDLDGLTAALGAFTFRATVNGTIFSNPDGTYSINVSQVGVYARDSYDFNGFQYLGAWNKNKNTVTKTNVIDGNAVYNSSFRDWRDKNKKGGDFLIFSNVYTFDTNDSFDFPVNNQIIGAGSTIDMQPKTKNIGR